MRFLADENLHLGLVEWLRGSGHDVLYAAESFSGDPDEILLERASTEGRILVTEERLKRLEAVWSTIQWRLEGHFVVLGDERVRIRPLTLPS